MRSWFKGAETDYVTYLIRCGFYDIGGAEESFHEYADSSVDARGLAAASTIVDDLDDDRRIEEFMKYKLLAAGYVMADMEEDIDLERKSAVVLKDSLCYFEGPTAYLNIHRAVNDNGIVIIIDSLDVVERFIQYFTDITVEYINKEDCCAQCGSNSEECECDNFIPYTVSVLRF